MAFERRNFSSMQNPVSDGSWNGHYSSELSRGSSVERTASAPYWSADSDGPSGAAIIRPLPADSSNLQREPVHFGKIDGQEGCTMFEVNQEEMTGFLRQKHHPPLPDRQLPSHLTSQTTKCGLLRSTSAPKNVLYTVDEDNYQGSWRRKRDTLCHQQNVQGTWHNMSGPSRVRSRPSVANFQDQSDVPGSESCSQCSSKEQKSSRPDLANWAQRDHNCVKTSWSWPTATAPLAGASHSIPVYSADSYQPQSPDCNCCSHAAHFAIGKSDLASPGACYHCSSPTPAHLECLPHKPHCTCETGCGYRQDYASVGQMRNSFRPLEEQSYVSHSLMSPESNSKGLNIPTYDSHTGKSEPLHINEREPVSYANVPAGVPRRLGSNLRKPPLQRTFGCKSRESWGVGSHHNQGVAQDMNRVADHVGPSGSFYGEMGSNAGSGYNVSGPETKIPTDQNSMLPKTNNGMIGRQASPQEFSGALAGDSFGNWDAGGITSAEVAALSIADLDTLQEEMETASLKPLDRVKQNRKPVWTLVQVEYDMNSQKFTMKNLDALSANQQPCIGKHDSGNCVEE